MNDETDDLYRALRKYLPAKVVVYEDDDDDEPRKVAVPNRKRRWPGVRDAINAKPWSRVVFLDKDGDELATFRTAEPPRAEAVAGVGLLAGGKRTIDTDLELMLRAMREAFSMRRDETKEVLAAMTAQSVSFGSVVKELSSSINVIGELHRAQLARVAAAVADGGGGGDEVDSDRFTKRDWAELATALAPGLAPHVLPIVQPFLPQLLEKFMPIAAEAMAPELAKIVAPGIKVQTQPAKDTRTIDVDDKTDKSKGNGANGKH